MSKKQTRIKRRLNKFMFWLNGLIWHSEERILRTYKPRKKPYIPVNKWAEALNKPYMPGEPEEYAFYPIFIIIAFSYLIFKTIIDLT